MHVLIVGPFTSGFGYFPAAKALGMDASIITTDKGLYEVPEEIKAQVKHFVVIDDFEITTLVAAALRLHAEDPINGIVPGVEFIVEQTAYAADALQLPNIGAEKVMNVRDKSRMREALRTAGVRAPRFARATNAVDLEQVIQTVGFPAVIKPLATAGSFGVARVNNTVELLAAYEDIVQDADDWKIGIGLEVIVEELLEGREYNADGFITADGEITVHELGQYDLGPQPHFQIHGITMRRAEDMPEAEALITYVKDVVRAVGINVGPFHAEIIITKDGPALVEIANRLPGAHMPALSEYITGISFAQNALACVAQTPLPKPAEPKARVAALRCIPAPAELLGRTYTKIEGWEALANDPHVDSLKLYVKPGEKISDYTDERSWIGEVLYHADDIDEADAFAKKIVESVHVVE